MAYGYIYKITTTESDKVYIGQTTKTVEKRFTEHLKNSTEESKKTLHLYLAMNKYGKETFSVEQIDTAKDRNELNRKERYWINYYNSINNGYNMMDGGNDENPMTSIIVKEKHDAKMRSQEVRDKISKAMKELRNTIGFSEEHRKKISEAQKDRQCFLKDGRRTYTAGANTAKINQLLADGWVRYVKTKKQKTNTSANAKIFATRSKAVYCILDTGARFEFDSILHAGKWWYDNYKPFGEVYSTATYQRKIEASIAGKEIECGNKNHKRYVHITNIKWFYVV